MPTYLLQKGYAFDLFSDKQLQAIKTDNQLLQTGSTNYQTILLAATKYVPLETMQQLVKLAEDGATILIERSLPVGVPGWAGLHKDQSAFNQLIAGLHFSNETGVRTAIAGKGRFLMGDDLQALLSTAKIRREAMVDSGLQFVRRQYQGGHYYFISNPGTKTFSGDLNLQSKATSVILFDPMLERSGLAKVKAPSNGNASFRLDLQPGESVIVQLSDVVIKGKPFPYTESIGLPQPIKRDWKIKFIQGGPVLPMATSVKTLGSWTELPGEEVKKFSGTAQYSVQFNKPAGKAAAWELDLGEVSESAEIILNGQNLATLLGPVYKIIVPSTAFKLQNELRINVTNGMANRIADLDKRGVLWKKFYNINFPARLPKNRGADGLFTAAQWLPKPAGLMGPVTWRPVIFVQ